MVEERVQRRLAAILATDVVGYSRLTEIDEEGTLARLKRIRAELMDPTIAEHRGVYYGYGHSVRRQERNRDRHTGRFRR